MIRFGLIMLGKGLHIVYAKSLGKRVFIKKIKGLSQGMVFVWGGMVADQIDSKMASKQGTLG